MPIMNNITGLNQVLGNLNRANKLIESRFRKGIIAAGLYLQRKSQEIVPVEEGNLKNTAFTRASGVGLFTSVIVGYTAEYAVFVHEDLTAAHGKKYNEKHALQIAAKHKTKDGKPFKTRGENQQAKFLERPARKNREVILGMIARAIAK